MTTMKRVLWPVVVASLLVPGAAGAQEPVTVQRSVSVPLGVAGMIVAAAGGALMLPYGKDYNILGTEYCVSDTSGTTYVSAGSCRPPADRVKIGALLLGSGVLAMWLGFRDHTVTVSPVVSKQTVGAVAAVRWGK
jgi:hypothetical protein